MQSNTQIIAEHLVSRRMDVSNYNVAIANTEATFILFNTSGQFVGFQIYKPFAEKLRQNDVEGRYFTKLSKMEHDNGRKATHAVGVFGIESLTLRYDVVFLVEGVFDATPLHNLGLPALAVLGCDPKMLVPFFKLFADRTVVAICDGDAAGTKLAKMADIALSCPPGKDIGDMSDSEIETFLERWLL